MGYRVKLVGFLRNFARLRDQVFQSERSAADPDSTDAPGDDALETTEGFAEPFDLFVEFSELVFSVLRRVGSSLHRPDRAGLVYE
jgi:hypothetical protein